MCVQWGTVRGKDRKESLYSGWVTTCKQVIKMKNIKRRKTKKAWPEPGNTASYLNRQFVLLEGIIESWGT